MAEIKLPPHLKKLAKALDSGRKFDARKGKPGRKLTDTERRRLGILIGANQYRSTTGKVRKIRK